MGAAAAMLLIKDPTIVFIDDERPKDRRIKGFSKQIFKRFEWPTLKFFCNTYNIRHEDMCMIFKRFLQYEEVYLLHFKVRTKDVRNHYSLHSKLEQEIADGVIPLMFMKDFAGLDPAPLPCDAVSLARFSIMSYIFCAEQIPDAIFGFMKMLKQKLAMTFEASLHSYSLDMLLKVMLEDLRPSAAGSILLESIERLEKDTELSLTTIVKYGIKYPILFYVFERFRKHMRRIVFGDKFWKGRPQMKLKMDEVQGSSAYFTHRFKDEATAMLETSRSIISDVVSTKRLKVYRLSDKSAPEVMCLDEASLQKLKDIFGYERSRQLAVDSEIVMECDSTFVERAFGQDSPVRYPARGVKVFPGSAPKGILEIPPEDENDEEQQAREGEGEGEGEEVEVGEGWYAEEEDSFGHHGGGGAGKRAAGALTLEVEPQTDEWEEGIAAGAPPTPGGYMSSLPSTPHAPAAFPLLPSGQLSATSSTPRLLRPTASSMLLRMSVASFASFALSWGSRPTTAEVEEQEPEPLQQANGDSHIETIFDTQQGREFRFDPETGKSAWVRSVVDRDGDLMLQYCS